MEFAGSRKKAIKHYAVYLIWGALTTGISIGLFELIRQVIPSLNENVANVISILVAIVFAYFTNRSYVFKSENENKKTEFVKFLISRGIGFVCETATFWLMINVVSTSEIIAKVASCGVAMIINYILSRFMVFKVTI